MGKEVIVLKCEDCLWLRIQPPHMGCCPNYKWRKWLSKEELETPKQCEWGEFKNPAMVEEIPLSGLDITDLFSMQKIIMEKVPDPIWDLNMMHIITCALGVIEESLEYINSIGRKPWRPTVLPEEEQLEELSDILHFYLELILRSGFTWEQVVEAYPKKHKENLERYLKGSQGDFSWDKRMEKEEL